MTLRNLLIAACCGAALAGCKTLDEASKNLQSTLGQGGDSQARADFLENRVGPFDEYVFGVNWAAKFTGAGLYKPEHPFNAYLQKVGTTLALGSNYPYTYPGYSFGVLDRDGRNALAVPSGFILLTRGLLDAVRSEDELAAILAHELAHHELRHNMAEAAAGKAYQTMEAVFGSGQGEEDIYDKMAVGYSERHELEADRRAVELLAIAGYDPYALVRVLERMKSYGGSLGGKGYPTGREVLAQRYLEELGMERRPIPEVRDRRFREAIAGFVEVETAQVNTKQ